MLHWLTEFAAPWNTLFADNALVSTGVFFLHITGVVVAAGTALSADRLALKSARFPELRAQYIKAAASVHRIVVFALAFVALAGVMLFLSDVAEFAGSLVFKAKLALVFLLLINGFAITRIEDGLRKATDPATADAGWHRLSLTARASQTLWFTTILAGVALRNM